ncbi:MAG: TIGR03790 family protein [Acidobacteriota bacterium]|nr:MAG: TIGR03790 family protein [Acidobacteriota bacterium]
MARLPRAARCVLCLVLSWAAAAGVAVHAAGRDDVLIIVNDNAIDSLAVGQYFAEQRGIDPANICHVSVPAGYFISWDEFRSLRDQIIAFMQKHTLPEGMEPVSCTDGDPPYYCQASADQLRDNTRIRYLVTTRGVPTRMTVDGSLLPYPGPTSVDNYLRYWVVRYFAQDVILNFTERRNAFKDGRGMREVDTSFDGELIVTRLDGLNLDAAKALVDRAMAAERTGIYGKHYGSKYGFSGGTARWYDYSTNRYVYGDAATSWRFQLGLVGEDRDECIDYLDFSASSPDGKAPAHCRARMTSGDDPPPGRASSRQPDPFDGLFYLGSLDGQPTTGSFRDFQNWRRDETCTVTLCRNAADPEACRLSSTDVFREINTDCMGVAEGFIGYNQQSFPVSYLTVWPTAWYGPGGGDLNRLVFPDVRDDTGHTDSHSLWYHDTNQVADPRCFAGSDFSSPPTEPCPDTRLVRIDQRISLSPRTINTADPQRYTIGLWYRTVTLSPSRSLRARLWVHEQGGSDIDYGLKTLATIGGDIDWTFAEVTYQLDPALHTQPDQTYDSLLVRLDTNSTFSGVLALDDVSVQEVGDPAELARNGSFNEGHEQVSGGDHAANFLSRLNGTAFFGSLSHHESGGHSFEKHPQETIQYFLRGLPFGDAVWWAENHNSGVVYADPFYSPTAVMLDYLNDADQTLDPFVPLYGSTDNGRDPVEVETDYEVDYCTGRDFYECDRIGSWLPPNVAGLGGQERQFLGDWDVSSIPQGDYTLRLAVTSAHPSSGRTQTFYDYYPVTVHLALPEVEHLHVEQLLGEVTRVFWDDQGLGTFYDLAGGFVSDLTSDQGFDGAQCLIDGTFQTEYFDLRSPPSPADGYYYLVRAEGAGKGSYGDGQTDPPDPRNELDLNGPCE